MISNFPLPPSANKLYRNVTGVGRVATKELRDYRKMVDQWAGAYSKYRTIFKEICDTKWKGNQTFKIDCFFVLKHERIWTKDNRPKRLDASNWIKACHDALADFLGIDDKQIWAGHFEKVSGEQECVVILISQVTPLTSVELLQQFTNESENPSLEQ